MNIQQKLNTVLKKKGIKDKDRLEELVDHYLSSYESLLAGGLSAYEASESCIQDLLETDLSSLITSKNKGRNIKMLFFFFILLMTNFYLLKPSPPNFNDLQINAQSSSFQYPIKGTQKVTSSFGMKTHPILKVLKLHKGIDIKAKLGTHIYPTRSGVVEIVGTNKEDGNFIIIRHDEAYISKYSHLKETYGVIGNKVASDTVIGLVGTTGLSTAPHLHFEVRKNGIPIDPMLYLLP